MKFPITASLIGVLSVVVILLMFDVITAPQALSATVAACALHWTAIAVVWAIALIRRQAGR